MKKIIFYALLLSLLYSGCKKDKLTKATQSGANTFSCKIDGKVFLPSKEGTSWSGANPLLVDNSSFNGFTLRARKFGSTNAAPENVIIKVSYLKNSGMYSLNIFPKAEYELDYAGGPTYRTNNTYTGELNITRCDTVNQIYSGTFSFTAIDDNTKKTMNVTDGRFDVKRQ